MCLLVSQFALYIGYDDALLEHEGGHGVPPDPLAHYDVQAPQGRISPCPVRQETDFQAIGRRRLGRSTHR